MKKKIVSVFLILALVLSFGSAAFAAEIEVMDNSAQPYDTNSVSFEIDRISASKADVYIDIHFSQVVDRYSVVIYLQKKVDGKWVIDTTNPERTLFNNGIKESSFYFYNRYTGLKRGVSYRIRCISKDYIDSSTSTLTTYSKPF